MYLYHGQTYNPVPPYMHVHCSYILSIRTDVDLFYVCCVVYQFHSFLYISLLFCFYMLSYTFHAIDDPPSLPACLPPSLLLSLSLFLPSQTNRHHPQIRMDAMFFLPFN